MTETDTLTGQNTIHDFLKREADRKQKDASRLSVDERYQDAHRLFVESMQILDTIDYLKRLTPGTIDVPLDTLGEYLRYRG